MASIVPTEGLDYLVGLLTGDTEQPESLYLGLLSGPDGETVPAANATLAAMGSGFAEASYTGYARVEVTANEWGAIGSQTIPGLSAARGSAASQQSFAAAQAADLAGPITGFFLTTAATGTSGVVLFYSNFSGGDGDVIAALALGDIVRVTPTFALADVAAAA